jgi:Rrf2 family iron-sulfur cluster assembly transcriptional regulator
MKLSTKGRHAVTAMVELALNHNKGPVTLADISDQQTISISYLEQLFAKLRQQGLVMGMRGPGGGYSLARPTHEISIADILFAVDDASKRQAVEPVGDKTADSLLVWAHLSNRIYDYLDSITLADAVETMADSGRKQVQASGMRKTAAA